VRLVKPSLLLLLLLLLLQLVVLPPPTVCSISICSRSSCTGCAASAGTLNASRTAA
jgi:hypothetical protein